MNEIVRQIVSPLFKGLTANANTTGFASIVPTVTRPSGAGVIDLNATPGQLVNGAMRLFPYGLGSANDAFSMRVIGWQQLGYDKPGQILWVPATMLEVSCTIGAMTGVAGSPVLNTELFCDTITIVKEPTITADTTPMGTVELFSPANDTVAWIWMRVHGCSLLQFDFDQTTNTPTMNVLVQYLAENH